MNEIDDEENNLPSMSDILAHVDGIPLPTEIKKSLWKAIGRLITGIVDWPVAHFEAKAQQIRAEADALSLVTKRAAEIAVKGFDQDSKLAERTISHFASKLLREQKNRENTVQLAIEDLKINPPSVDAQSQLEDDWLEMFSRICETKSNEEIQLFLARILSGEIRKPGSFSPKTIQTLSTLDQKTAEIFQSFCNISFEIPQIEDFVFVICDPFGSPGNNGLLPLGLSYSDLSQLQDGGLIQHDLNAWREISPIFFQLPLKVGSKSYDFTSQISDLLNRLTNNPIVLKEIRVNSINLTNVGLQLRKVLHLSSNPIYNTAFEKWIIDKLQNIE